MPTPDPYRRCTTCRHLSREAPTSGHVGRCEWAALPAWLMRSLEWRYRRDRDVYNGWESCATWEPREGTDGRRCRGCSWRDDDRRGSEARDAAE